MRHLLLAAVLLAAPAQAHRQWFLPAATTLADTGQWVTFDAAASNDLFYADHVPLQLAQVKVWAPDGAAGAIENGAVGKYRSTFDVKIDKPGTWKIGLDTQTVTGSFKLNGEDWRVGGRRGPMGAAAPRSVATPADIPAGATEVKLTEIVNRNLVFVTAGEPSADAFKATGRGLELQPVTHPTALVADEAGQFRFLIDGRPAAGVKVEVVPGSKRFRAAENAQTLTTGTDGLVRVTWPTPGVYWISATHTDAKVSTPRATERRMTYTTTVEVPAP